MEEVIRLSTKAKAVAGKKAAELIENGMVVGLGTGSTARCFIDALAARCHSGLKVAAVATSQESERQARLAGIPIADLDQLETIDIDIDGADEIDSKKRMIKGGGGALFREKIIAGMSKEMLVIIDSSKQVEALGAFPLPVEISLFAHQATLKQIRDLGYRGSIRKNSKGKHFITENQNLIFDIELAFPCHHPEEIEDKLIRIPGVISTGFFIGYAGRVIVGYEDGSTITRS